MTSQRTTGIEARPIGKDLALVAEPLSGIAHGWSYQAPSIYLQGSSCISIKGGMVLPGFACVRLMAQWRQCYKQKQGKT